MDCCCPCGSRDLENDANPGPNVSRQCTDTWCIAVLALAVAFPSCLFIYLKDSHSATNLYHGKDHYRNFCGMGELEDKKFVYFPDLQEDMAKDPTLRSRYGVCVERCPSQGSFVQDYHGMVSTEGAEERRRDEPWYVPLPTFSWVQRCIPFEPPWTFQGEMEFCASPSCKRSSEIPKSRQEVCGLKRDGTDDYWPLSKADDILIDGWYREGVAKEVIEARKAMTEKDAASTGSDVCQVKVIRDTRVRMQSTDSKVVYALLTKYTGVIFTWSAAVYENQHVVLGLGVVGALTVSFVFIVLFACCVRIVLIVLCFMLFTVLIAADYVLFFQAGLVTGRSGRMFIEKIEKAAHIDIPDSIQRFVEDNSADNAQTAETFKWCAIGLAVFIFLLACVLVAAKKNFSVLVELLRETSRTLRQMPSLLIAPFFLAVSMVITSLFLLRLALAISTVSLVEVPQLLALWSSTLAPLLERFGLHDNEDTFQQVRQILLGVTGFCFLWAYYFHVALYICMVAMTVSHWYFYRKDPLQNAGTGIHSHGWFFGRPVLVALARVARYHLGSLAFGSCIMAVATSLRMVMEFIISQTKSETNTIVRMLAAVTRCALWCLEKCVQFITEYAYVYVAVTGKPFCSAARSSFVFFVKYPVQTAMDHMASMALGWLLCLTVPASMAVISWVLIHEDWPPCAFFIVGLAYVITRLSAGIYDVSLTTLFVCAMRDCENYGGIYMSKRLRQVIGLADLNADANNGSIEMRESVDSTEPES